MVFTPFTLEEAIDIAEDFEDLIDTDFDMDGAVYEVVDVVICPFNEDDGKKFVENYLVTQNKETSLSFYGGEEYDVVIFACDIDEDAKYTFIDIRTFANKKGISYNFPDKE